MNFFQRIGNALSRFMYGRNGVDRLCAAMIWVAVILNLVTVFLTKGSPTVYRIFSFVSTVTAFLALYRMFSRNLEKRRAENARFMDRVWLPVSRRLSDLRQRRGDRDHRYFTCPGCGAVCRVPRGKGRIVITCPRCGREIHGKS